VFADGEGGVEAIRLDQGLMPAHWRVALDTTAAPNRLRTVDLTDEMVANGATL
jgi:hypothetical protein